MSREEWVKFIESNPSIDTFIVKYCIHKGKPEALSRLFYITILNVYGVNAVIDLKEAAYRDLAIEFNFMKLTDKEGNLIKLL